MTHSVDDGSVETKQDSAAIIAEMKASGHGQNYFARGDMNFISTSHGLARADRIQPYNLEGAARNLVRPQRYDDAFGVLLNNRVVILSGGAGSGRNTVAKALFHHINQKRQESPDPMPPVTVRELIPDWVDPDVEYLPPSRVSGYILELTRAGDTRPSLGFGQDLLEHAETLRKEDSYLALLTTEDEWHECALATSSITIPVVAPPAEDVVSHLLEHHYLKPSRTPYLKKEPFASILASDVSPENAVELAEAIANSEGDLESLFQVAERFQGWRQYLLNWFEVNPEIGVRARLIAAALLGTAQDADILDAADELLNLLEPHQDLEGPLSGPDLSKKLEALQAERLAGGKLSITAKRPRLDAAVLDHVWGERPQLRKIFTKWVIKVTESAPEARLGHIASQLVGLAVRQAPDTFFDVVITWASGTVVHRRLVTEMLNLTVLDRALGRDVREKMRAWAVQDKTTPALRDIVAEVCGRHLATEKPDVALTRLRLVLSVEKHDPTVALRAVRTIASLPGLAHPTLRRVRGWMVGEARLAGARAFVALMRVDTDLNTPVLPILPKMEGPKQDMLDELRAGWSAAVERPDLRNDVATVMLSWLEAADHGVLDPNQVVSVLAPVLTDSLDRSLVGRILRTSDATSVGGSLVTVSTGQRLFEEVMWPGSTPIKMSTGADEICPATEGGDESK